MTEFEYAGFVSYRNSRKKDGILSTFARQFTKILSDEVVHVLHYDLSEGDNENVVFFDEEIIGNTDSLPHKLGQGLCKSVCWIVLFTRDYLRGSSLWCASELHAMMVLQRQREAVLNLNHDEHRFIMPLLLRGNTKDMPHLLKNHIFTEKFERYGLHNSQIKDDPEFYDCIRELAEVIATKHKLLVEKCEEHGVNLIDLNSTFTIKHTSIAEERVEIEEFIRSLQPTKPKAPKFPF
jgi:hypothetical protein